MPQARTCKHCRSRKPAEKMLRVPMGWFCDSSCAYAWAGDKQKAARERKAKQAHKDAKQRIKSRGDWLREAQAAFNRFIRLRDASLPCVSCGRQHDGQYHAGHYRSVGAAPELRFAEANCHKQCAPCNNHLSGNLVNYRIELIKRIGLEGVEKLEGKHDPLKLTIEDIEAIRDKYRAKCRDLEREINC